MHILPDQFIKIRHYGILSNRNRHSKLVVAKTLLGVSDPNFSTDVRETWQDLLTRITGTDPRICPYCGKGRMVLKEILKPSALSP